MYDDALRGVQNLASNSSLRLCGVSVFEFRVSGFGFPFALATGRSRSGVGITFCGLGLWFSV